MRPDQTHLFPLIRSMRIASALAFVLFGWATYETFADPSQWWRVRLGFLAGTVFAVTLPSTIALTSDGVERRRLFGLWKTKIAWKDIQAVVEIDGEIQVNSGGRKITHSHYHQDPAGFEAGLTQYGIRVGRIGEF